MPFEVTEVANIYSLLQTGVSYTDALNMPADMADKLLMLHKEVKSHEEAELKKAARKKR